MTLELPNSAASWSATVPCSKPFHLTEKTFLISNDFILTASWLVKYLNDWKEIDLFCSLLCFRAFNYKQINIPVKCVKLRNLCICPNEKKTIFFAFWTLECFNWNLHSLTFDRARLRGVRQRNILTHFSILRETSQVNYNRSIKLIGIFGWCQMTLFFTYCPPHALHTAQITSKCRIFFRLWFDQHIRIECITGGEETS